MQSLTKKDKNDSCFKFKLCKHIDQLERSLLTTEISIESLNECVNFIQLDFSHNNNNKIAYKRGQWESVMISSLQYYDFQKRNGMQNSKNHICKSNAVLSERVFKFYWIGKRTLNFNNFRFYWSKNKMKLYFIFNSIVGFVLCNTLAGEKKITFCF